MSTDSIARVRRFQRAATTEIGLLDESFLGRGRPLGPARVLNAIGKGHEDVSEIRAYLRLDSGLMSRILRGLEGEGLVEVGTAPGDSRKRRVRLTEAGAKEFAAYEALSDAQAAAILERHGNSERLLAAMDVVASALGRDAIEIVEVDPADPRAQACMARYYAELAARFERGFDVALSCDPEADEMMRPRGSFLLAVSDEVAVGCAGLKGTDKGYGEVKRVWVDPSVRGLGLSRRMMARLEEVARELGIGILRLDTNSALPEAVALYRRSGWNEIPRFNEDPYPDLFFEKVLIG